MKKSILLLLLIITTGLTYAQTPFSALKYGNVLIKCFYTFKVASSTPLSQESQQTLKQKISDMCTYMQTQLIEHKGVLLNKLGLTDLKELENQVKNYQQFAGMSEESITEQEKMSIDLWISVSKVEVGKLFIKLNR